MNRFAICQAFMQLEADYNRGGILVERPSNQRRRESIGVQLFRMGFSSGMGWVDITQPRSSEGYDEDDEVREIYMRHVLLWNLPIDAELERAMRDYFVPEYLSQFPHFKEQ